MNDECTKNFEFLPDFLQKVIGMKKKRKDGEKRREKKKDGRRKEGKKEVSIENLNIIDKFDRVHVYHNSCSNKLEV